MIWFMYTGMKIMHAISIRSVIPIIWSFLFLVIPFIYIILISFSSKSISIVSYNGYMLVFNIYFGHYLEIITGNIYLFALLNSLYISFCTTFLCIVLGYPSAYFISRIASHKVKLFYKSLIAIPCWISFFMRIGSILNIMNMIGMDHSVSTVIIGGVSCFLPFTIFAIQGLIEQVDKSILEAARDLGMNHFNSLVKVLFPITRRGIFNIAGYVLVPMLGEYFIIELLGGGNSVVVGRVIHSALVNGNIEFAAAYTIFVVLMISPLIYLYRKYI